MSGHESMGRLADRNTAPGRRAAGCTAATFDTTPTQEDGHRDSGAETSGVSAAVLVENRTTETRTASVTLEHTETPACRYDRPTCGAPRRETTLLQARVGVGGGEQTMLGPVDLDRGIQVQTVDSYLARVETPTEQATLRGLETGAASVVGEDRAATYGWRVGPYDVTVHATLDADGIDMAVAPREPTGD
ncbi:MAG: hypothetical protein ABEJ44_01945 [Halanaeroarchaeum sp.]